MYTNVNGITLAYDQSGSGKMVLFVHGYPLNRTLWRPQIKGLSNSASIYAVDLRGHGESNDTENEYSMELFADDLAAFVKSVGGNRPVILCGLSMGGYVVFAFYRKYPQLVSGLVLTATRAAADSQEGKANRDKAIETVQKQGREVIFQAMLPKLLAPASVPHQAELTETTLSIMRSAAQEMTIVKDLKALRDRSDATSLLSEIEIPTLIIHGAGDQIIPVEEAQVMQSAIPGSKLVVLQKAGHLLNLEQPEPFNEAFAQFLKQFSARQ